LNMVIQHIHKIHLVQLASGKYQDIFSFKWSKTSKTLAYGIRSTLVPGWISRRLFGRKNIHECRAERTEMIGILNMPVQGCRIELRKYKHSVDAGIQTVGNRNIPQPVFACNRNSWFGTAGS